MQAGLESWGQTVPGRTDWNSLAVVKKLYPRADQVGRRTVFNMSGYQFRLVARMNCLRGPRVVETEQETEHKHLLQQVNILALITHWRANPRSGAWRHDRSRISTPTNGKFTVEACVRHRLLRDSPKIIPLRCKCGAIG